MCHEQTDLRATHNPGVSVQSQWLCDDCHANSTYPDLLDETWATTECLDCHQPGHVGTKTYSPAEVAGNHDAGSAASHTVDASQSSATTSTIAGSVACASCHQMDVNTEHAKTTANMPLWRLREQVHPLPRGHRRWILEHGRMEPAHLRQVPHVQARQLRRGARLVRLRRQLPDGTDHGYCRVRELRRRDRAGVAGHRLDARRSLSAPVG